MSANKAQDEQLPQDAVMQSVLKASDLRIGNKLLFLGDVVTFKNITEFREDGIFWIKTFEPKIESKNFHFKPIQLTEEWHNKFGVYKNGFNSFEYEIDDIFSFGIKIVFTEDYVFLRQGNKHSMHEDDVISIWNKDLTKRNMYVHEFQNLYFSLTQRELTVA